MFGFGKGKLRITLQQQQFAQGDTIQGNVTVTMRKQVDANKLVITLNGTETVVRRNLKGGSTNETHTICDQPLTLAEKPQYPLSQEITIPFTITIPKLPQQQAAEKLAEKSKLLGAVVAVANMATSRRQKWWLRARLDVPGLDIRSKRAYITVQA